MAGKSGFLPIATALVGVGVFALATQVRAGGDKVVFPEGFDKGVLYTTVDRADNKQYRELYTSQKAIDAVKKGEPMPDGTVVTLVQYKAKLDAAGNPEKDANGRFIKTDILGYIDKGPAARPAAARGPRSASRRPSRRSSPRGSPTERSSFSTSSASTRSRRR